LRGIAGHMLGYLRKSRLGGLVGLVQVHASADAPDAPDAPDARGKDCLGLLGHVLKVKI
jgi:hypothetical protein